MRFNGNSFRRHTQLEVTISLELRFPFGPIMQERMTPKYIREDNSILFSLQRKNTGIDLHLLARPLNNALLVNIDLGQLLLIRRHLINFYLRKQWPLLQVLYQPCSLNCRATNISFVEEQVKQLSICFCKNGHCWRCSAFLHKHHRLVKMSCRFLY